MARSLPHKTTHVVGGKKVKVARKLQQAHVDAGYHDQEFGEPPAPDHDLVGEHATPAGTILVEYTEGEPEFDDEGRLVGGSYTHGPEFRVTLPDGARVQVLCADTAKQYLANAWS
jgi:hypothetical protein